MENDRVPILDIIAVFIQPGCGDAVVESFAALDPVVEIRGPVGHLVGGDVIFDCDGGPGVHTDFPERAIGPIAGVTNPIGELILIPDAICVAAKDPNDFTITIDCGQLGQRICYPCVGKLNDRAGDDPISDVHLHIATVIIADVFTDNRPGRVIGCAFAVPVINVFGGISDLKRRNIAVAVECQLAETGVQQLVFDGQNTVDIYVGDQRPVKRVFRVINRFVCTCHGGS